MQYYDFLPAPNPLVQAADPEIKPRMVQIKKKDAFDERDCSFNMWDYFSDNKLNLVYQRFDNYPWSMIPLNNHRFAASCFFDCKKLLSLNREIRLTEFPQLLYKNLFPTTMKYKDPKQLILEQDQRRYNGLKFDSQFESGNLFTSYKVAPNEYDLMMQNDTNSKGNTQWFFFSVENTTKNSEVTFNIINFIKCDSLFNMGQRLVVFSTKNNKAKGSGWVKSGYNIAYFKNKFKRENSQLKTYYTLTFTYKFEHSNDKVYFAQCYPYTYQQLNIFIERVIKPNKFSVVKELCKTISKLSCPFITIGNGKRAILLMARQHPGETPGSFALEGTMEFLVSNSMEADILRQNFTFYIIPMINPDGVVFGNYRCNLYGVDLNRIWIIPHKDLHDSVWYVRELIKQIRQTSELSLIVDFHGHSKKLNSFFYANSCCDEQKLFPLIGSTISKMINLKDCSFSIHESKKKTARAALQDEVTNGFTYTVEISFHAYRKQLTQDFTEASYKQLGEDIGLSIFKLYESSMIKQSKLPRVIGLYLSDEIDKMLRECDLSQLKIGQDDTGSDSSPEDDALLEQELNSFNESKRQCKIIISAKKKSLKFDKATQTDIQHYQNLMLDEKVLQRIEEQVKAIRKPATEAVFILDNDVPFNEGQISEFQQTDISLQQILGKMQVYHVRVSNKNSMYSNQFTTQSSKPVVIVLKNPYSKQQLQQQQMQSQVTQQPELTSIKNNRKRATSITGRSSIEHRRLVHDRKYSIQQYPQERAHGNTYHQGSPSNLLTQDATFEKIANIIVAFIGLILYDLIFFTTYTYDICPPIEYTAARLLYNSQDLYPTNNFLAAQTTTNTTTNATDTNSTTSNTTDTNSTTTNTTDTNSTTTNTTDATTNSTTDNTTTTTDSNVSDTGLANPLVKIPFIIILLYFGIIGLVLLAMLGIYCFGKMSSERFGSLNMCWACLGIYVRNFAVLTRLCSLVGLLLIAIQAILTLTSEECQTAVHEYKSNRKIYKIEGALYSSSIQLVLVNLGFWGATHCIIPTLKLCIDAESFLYEPFDRSKGLVYWLCCIMLGP